MEKFKITMPDGTVIEYVGFRLGVDDPLHPTGKCRCAGEGTCEWCTTSTVCGCTNATCGSCGAEDVAECPTCEGIGEDCEECCNGVVLTELQVAQLEVALTYTAPAVAVLDRAEDALAQLRYPLYCVDRGDVFADARFAGPFATHDEAQQHAGADDLIVRCRRLRPSEVRFCYDDVLDWPDAEAVCDVIEQHITRDGDIPDPAWYSFAERRIVHVEHDDGTLPVERDAKAWCDAHLRLDVYICEGDE